MARDRAKQTEQSQRFVDAARTLGTDESEEAFIKVLRKVASAPPPTKTPKREKPKTKKPGP